MTSERAIALAGKHLAMAAPSSHGTDAERASHALEAARLVAEYDLVVNTRPARRAAPSPPVQRPMPFAGGFADLIRRRVGVSDFRPAIAAMDTECGVESCDLPIFEGERVYRRTKAGAIEYIHVDCWHGS